MPCRGEVIVKYWPALLITPKFLKANLSFLMIMKLNITWYVDSKDSNTSRDRDALFSAFEVCQKCLNLPLDESIAHLLYKSIK